jgi:HD-like signal output (HDOD) protein
MISSSVSVPTASSLAQALGPVPPSAHVLVQLQRLLADLNSGLDDIANLVRLDAAMATRIIRVSNSAWFGRGLPCKTVEEAVNRIGFREVYHFVAVAASSALVAQPVPAYSRDSLGMWTDSVACAFAAETLAGILGEDTANAYLTGLLHAIGRLPVNQYLVSQGLVKPFADEGHPHDHTGAEFAALGFNQAGVGACLLAQWEFPAGIVEPVRHQYDPTGADDPHDRAAALLYAARLLRSVANEVDVPEAETDPQEGAVYGILNLARADILECAGGVRDRLARTRALMKV